MEMVAIRVLVLVFSVVVHEVAHGWMALKLGDTTARDQGRLTLNPLPHVDPMGSVIVPLLLSLTGSIMMGWAKPVPVHPGRLRHPWNDHPKVAAAGPASNLLLALIAAVLLGATAAIAARLPVGHAAAPAAEFLLLVWQTGIVINVVLAVFNLIPLPPLDGSWILTRFLPDNLRDGYERLRNYGMLVVVGFLLLMHYTPAGDYLQVGMMAVASPFFNLAIAVARLGA
ncbi:MAG: site-2 protease family protein [bacterium]|nr:site-2 protease family protein [bacterium]MBK9474082.1 site-2 protease family protein [bacterium]